MPVRFPVHFCGAGSAFHLIQYTSLAPQRFRNSNSARAAAQTGTLGGTVRFACGVLRPSDLSLGPFHTLVPLRRYGRTPACGRPDSAQWVALSLHFAGIPGGAAMEGHTRDRHAGVSSFRYSSIILPLDFMVASLRPQRLVLPARSPIPGTAGLDGIETGAKQKHSAATVTSCRYDQSAPSSLCAWWLYCPTGGQ